MAIKLVVIWPYAINGTTTLPYYCWQDLVRNKEFYNSQGVKQFWLLLFVPRIFLFKCINNTTITTMMQSCKNKKQLLAHRSSWMQLAGNFLLDKKSNRHQNVSNKNKYNNKRRKLTAIVLSSHTCNKKKTAVRRILDALKELKRSRSKQNTWLYVWPFTILFCEGKCSRLIVTF